MKTKAPTQGRGLGGAGGGSGGSHFTPKAQTFQSIATLAVYFCLPLVPVLQAVSFCLWKCGDNIERFRWIQQYEAGERRYWESAR